LGFVVEHIGIGDVTMIGEPIIVGRQHIDTPRIDVTAVVKDVLDGVSDT